MNISSFYKLLHLFNTFLQIGKTFFTKEPYYICKLREVTKKIHHRKEDKKMKRRKKYFIIGAVILSLAILGGLGVTMAYGPHGSWHKGFHHRFHSQDFTDFILWRMDRHAKELNLNETQMQEYEKIKGLIRANITAAIEEKKEFHKIMHEEINSSNPNINNVANLVKDQLKNMPNLIGKNLDLFVEFYNVLDENQKARVIEMIRWRMG
jgi:hypothetical protein